MEHYSASEQETEALGEALVSRLSPGAVVAFTGDLGAGKTAFVRGMARGLGITQRVTSPTFTIVNEYEGGRLPLFHFDLYRLESRDELEDIGYWELLEGDGVSFIEWGNKFPQSAPLDYLEVRIDQENYNMRTIWCRSHGQRSRRLLFLWSRDAEAQLDPVPDHKRRI